MTTKAEWAVRHEEAYNYLRYIMALEPADAMVVLSNVAARVLVEQARNDEALKSALTLFFLATSARIFERIEQ